MVFAGRWGGGGGHSGELHRSYETWWLVYRVVRIEGQTALTDTKRVGQTREVKVESPQSIPGSVESYTTLSVVISLSRNYCCQSACGLHHSVS